MQDHINSKRIVHWLERELKMIMEADKNRKNPVAEDQKTYGAETVSHTSNIPS